MSKFLSGVLVATFCISLSAQTKLPSGWQSSLVKITPQGKLVYFPDSQGNILPDFSRVGYHHSDKSIPYNSVDRKSVV